MGPGNAAWVHDVFAFRGSPAVWEEVLEHVQGATVRPATPEEAHKLRRLDDPIIATMTTDDGRTIEVAASLQDRSSSWRRSTSTSTMPSAPTRPPADGSMEETRPTDVLGLVTHRSGWDRIRLYGASVTADHVRRRADTITLVLYVLALLVLVPAARTTDGVEAALTEVVASLPAVVAPFAALPYDLVAVCGRPSWVALALLRRHWRLTLSLITAVPVAACVTLVLNDALGLEGEARELALGAPQDGVPIQLVLSLAVASSRPGSRAVRSGRQPTAWPSPPFSVHSSCPLPRPTECCAACWRPA